jgi:hypothetical protein
MYLMTRRLVARIADRAAKDMGTMDTPLLTPQRQKMLIGAASAGLLLVLGFSFAPSPDLAKSANVDDELALIVDDGSDVNPARIRPSLDRRKPAHREQKSSEPSRSEDPGPTEIEGSVAPRQMPVITEARDLSAPLVAVARGPVIPTPYQQRLELLKEEEAALRRHQQRRADEVPASVISEPMPTVTVASVEGPVELSPNVDQAFAEAHEPARLRRVELAGREARPSDDHRRAERRGAWLSGSIEIE